MMIVAIGFALVVVSFALLARRTGSRRRSNDAGDGGGYTGHDTGDCGGDGGGGCD